MQRSSEHRTIPDGWQRVRLGDVAVINPKRPRLGVDADEWVTFVPMASVGEDFSGIKDSQSRTYSEVSKGYTYFEEDDLLFSKITPCLQNGKHSIANNLLNGFGFGSTEFHIVRSADPIYPRFLFRALTRPEVIKECADSFTGTAGQQRVQPDTLRSLPILLPPLPEQRAIAAVLDSLDDAIKGAEAAIAATEGLRDALLHDLLTRGLPGQHTEFRDVPGLGTIPADWDVVRLGDVAEVVMGQSPPGLHCNHDGEGIPLLNGPTEYGPSHPEPIQWTTDSKKMSREGDVLFCVRGATAGRMNWADRDYAIGRGVAAIRHRSGQPFQRYLRAVLDFRLPGLLSVVTGSTFPNLGYDQITQLRVSGIPLTEQHAIASALDGVDGAIQVARAELNGLRCLKDSTADALLTGRVRADSFVLSREHKLQDSCRQWKAR